MRSARIVLALAVALLLACPALAAPEKSAGEKAAACPAAKVCPAAQEVMKVSKEQLVRAGGSARGLGYRGRHPF
jgi:hypothetical protein